MSFVLIPRRRYTDTNLRHNKDGNDHPIMREGLEETPSQNCDQSQRGTGRNQNASNSRAVRPPRVLYSVKDPVVEDKSIGNHSRDNDVDYRGGNCEELVAKNKFLVLIVDA